MFWGVIEVYFKCLYTKFQREILKLPGAVPIRSWAVPSNTCIFSMNFGGGVVRKVSKNRVWVNLLSENNNAINSAFFGVLWVINWAFKRSIILVFAQLESKFEVGQKRQFYRNCWLSNCCCNFQDSVLKFGIQALEIYLYHPSKIHQVSSARSKMLHALAKKFSFFCYHPLCYKIFVLSH